MTTPDRALNRIKRSTFALWEFKNVVYKLRRIVAGDLDALKDGTSPGRAQDHGVGEARAHQSFRPDILVKDFQEGRDNAILNLLITLAWKTAYNFPMIRMEGISPKEQIVNAQYVKQRMGPKISGGCHAMEHGQIALLDYLMGGLGAIFTTYDEKGRPENRWADTLDLNWDQTARLPCDMNWFSLTVTEPLWKWLQMFPDAKPLQDLREKQPRGADGRYGVKDDDRPTELEFYYDQDDEGAYICFLKDGENSWNVDPVYKGQNPHRCELGGVEQPFLPLETILFMNLPSVRLPVSNAQKMLPAQIAIWKAVNRIQTIGEKGKGFYEVDRTAMGSREIDDFLEAYEAGVVMVDEFGKIKEHSPMQIQQTDLEELNRNLQVLNLQGGVSPYSMGGKAPGVQLATEARLIAGQGELVTGVVASANARLWGAATVKFLWNGKQWDKNPFSCRVNDVLMEFGPGKPLGPVAQYLRPDAEITVSEDSMKFFSREQLLADAMADVKLGTEVAQFFPEWLKRALRRFGEAMGVSDIEDRLAPPAPMPMPGGMAPGQGMPLPPGGGPVGMPNPAMIGEGATQR